MTKNQLKEVEYADLGITGSNYPIGIIEAVMKIPEYTSTCEVVTLRATLIRVKIDAFVNIVKSSHVWELIEK